MLNVNKLPALDIEVGVPGASKHSPTAVGAVSVNIGLLIAIFT